MNNLEVANAITHTARTITLSYYLKDKEMRMYEVNKKGNKQKKNLTSESMKLNMHKISGEACEMVLKAAIGRRTFDNITVLLLTFSNFKNSLKQYAKDLLYSRESNQTEQAISNPSTPTSSQPITTNIKFTPLNKPLGKPPKLKMCISKECNKYKNNIDPTDIEGEEITEGIENVVNDLDKIGVSDPLWMEECENHSPNKVPRHSSTPKPHFPTHTPLRPFIAIPNNRNINSANIHTNHLLPHKINKSNCRDGFGDDPNNSNDANDVITSQKSETINRGQSSIEGGYIPSIRGGNIHKEDTSLNNHIISSGGRTTMKKPKLRKAFQHKVL